MFKCGECNGKFAELEESYMEVGKMWFKNMTCPLCGYVFFSDMVESQPGLSKLPKDKKKK